MYWCFDLLGQLMQFTAGAMDDGNKRQAMQSAITRCYGCTTVSAAEAAGRACSLHGQTLVLAIDRQLNPGAHLGTQSVIKCATCL